MASVIAGRSGADGSLLTGESLPLAKGAGARVVGGSINVESPLTLRVDQVGPDTVLSSILRLLDRAQTEKAATRATGGPRRRRGLPRSRSSSPRLPHSTGGNTTHPAGYRSPWRYWLSPVRAPCRWPRRRRSRPRPAASRGSACWSRARARSFETLARATHFVFDKTGTLTVGRPRLLETGRFRHPTARSARGHPRRSNVTWNIPFGVRPARSGRRCDGAVHRRHQYPWRRPVGHGRAETCHYVGTPDFIRGQVGHGLMKTRLLALQAPRARPWCCSLLAPGPAGRVHLRRRVAATGARSWTRSNDRGRKFCCSRRSRTGGARRVGAESRH